MRTLLRTLMIAGALVTVLFGLPPYFVWQQRLSGEAELRKAEYSRQVLAVEASAKRDAAKMLAEAEIERSKGVAEANRIIGQSLTNNEAYLRYLWVQNLADGKSEVIYVPTEANLPILEAGRLGAGQRHAAADAAKAGQSAGQIIGGLPQRHVPLGME